MVCGNAVADRVDRLPGMLLVVAYVQRNLLGLANSNDADVGPEDRWHEVAAADVADRADGKCAVLVVLPS